MSAKSRFFLVSAAFCSGSMVLLNGTPLADVCFDEYDDLPGTWDDEFYEPYDMTPDVEPADFRLDYRLRDSMLSLPYSRKGSSSGVDRRNRRTWKHRGRDRKQWGNYFDGRRCIDKMDTCYANFVDDLRIQRELDQEREQFARKDARLMAREIAVEAEKIRERDFQDWLDKEERRLDPNPPKSDDRPYRRMRMVLV